LKNGERKKEKRKEKKEPSLVHSPTKAPSRFHPLKILLTTSAAPAPSPILYHYLAGWGHWKFFPLFYFTQKQDNSRSKKRQGGGGGAGTRELKLTVSR
jgi:hypothetical protein